eukprot:441436_1
MEEKNEHKNDNTDMFTAFVSHMSLDEATRLKINDTIDHRDTINRFILATITDKQGTNLKIHYNGWGSKWDAWSDYNAEIHRFAIAGSISERSAHRCQQLDIGDHIGINPMHRCPGWKFGEIKRMDEKSGQVQIRYRFGHEIHLYWAHLDNTLEIVDFSVSGYPVSVNEETNEVSWIFEGFSMDKFKKTKNGEKFVTKTFELLNCSWEIMLYPNGENKDNEDYVSIFVQCTTLPDGCSKLAANMQITFVEANCILQLSECYVKRQNCGFIKGMKRDLIKDKMTIKIKINVTDTTVNEGCLVWKVNGFLLDVFRKCKTNKCFRSPTIETNGLKWNIVCYPHGSDEHDAKQHDMTDMNITFAETGEYTSIACTIECEQANYKATSYALIDAETVISNAIFGSEIFDNSQEVTIRCRIYPMNGPTFTDATTNECKWIGFCKKNEHFIQTINFIGLNWKIQKDEQSNVIKLQLEKHLPGFFIRIHETIELLDTDNHVGRVSMYNNSELVPFLFQLSPESWQRDESVLIKCKIQLLWMIREDNYQKIPFDSIVTVPSKMKPYPKVVDDDILYDKHENIIELWNKHSAKLESASRLSNNKSFIQSSADNDDEKENEETFSVADLFNKYAKYHSIVQEQLQRLELVTTNDYLLELVTHQKSTSELTKDHELKLLIETKQNENEHTEYEKLKKQRIYLQNKIETE